MDKLGIIVPYKNRPQQLFDFKLKISSYLTEHNINYELIIVEQNDKKSFNRGKLLNIGFEKAKVLGCTYVCFHDVDMHPVKVDYSPVGKPTQLANRFVYEEGVHRTITDDYFGRAGDNSWEDLGIIVSGPQAQKLSDYFEDLARASNNGKVRYRSIRNIIHQWRPGIGQVQWLLGGPTNRISPWAITFKRSLEAGKKFDIVSAYFSPSQTILRRLAKAAKHNKGSRLVVAGKTDNNATIAAARLLYRHLMRRKTRIFEFQSRPLHMKLMVIDDTVYIGSANLDVRSMFINLEIMVRIKDAGLALHMRKLIDELVTQSEEQTRILLKARDSYWSRFKAALAYFLVNSVDYTIGRRITFGLIRNR
mgnify:CR=1 FL=1